MAILVSPRRKVKRLTDRLAGGKNPHRKRNQERAARRELSSFTLEPTPKEIRDTIRSRAFAARLAHQRLQQLHSVKNVLAENKKKLAVNFIEIAANEKNPLRAQQDWAIAQEFLSGRIGKQSTDAIKAIIRGMNSPVDRARIIYELKHGITPEVKHLVEQVNRFHGKKKRRRK